ncbi:MAG: NUDIX hydrolase [Planctomycetota bacterium]|jgi:8-oxo-dGTP pyrophosphatase MutT (NUDIX family)
MSESSAPNPFGPGVERALRAQGAAADAAGAGDVVPARPASTVVVLRESAGGLETFLVQRSRKLAFMGGAFVFPGGRVDASDGSPQAAGVREVHEEIGVELRPEGLLSWSRWVTPVIEPRRYDAHFFIAEMPQGQTAEAVIGEVTSGRWFGLREAIAEQGAGSLILAPPTLWTIMALARHEGFAAACAEANRRDPVPVYTPRARPHEQSGIALVIEGDPAYEDEAAEPAVDAMRRFVLCEGRWEVIGGPFV